ncbi:MAG TPA: membrane dipeptidase [Rhizobiaceae bacterium]|nr:membrane dipeptidase [Rhizobiaceae bacterium]
MRRLAKILAYGFALLVAAGVAFFFLVLPGLTDSLLNPTLNPGPYKASSAATDLHKRLTVADLHADSLLFGRDLLKKSRRGHVDIPRLIEGNVALQIFSVVTKSPRFQNYESNSGNTDNITLVAIANGWPRKTWSSLKERALYQAGRLHEFAAKSDNQLVLIRSKGDLQNFLKRRQSEPRIVAGVLALEGAHVLEGDVKNVDVMFDAGYRMMSFAHFFDSEVAGSAHGIDKGGLTGIGLDVVMRMEAKNMIIDLAHASDAQIDDVLAVASKPVVVSHTGVKGTCDNRRNLSDAQLRGIARTGGLVGIGYWSAATCGKDVASIVKAIRYTVDVVGVDHVGLGSDYDGAVAVPFDTSGLVLLTEGLMNAGFSEADIAKIMGGNQIRLLEQGLPD